LEISVRSASVAVTVDSGVGEIDALGAGEQPGRR
jgi:hypothetical protein